MKKLQIDESRAKKLYKSASKEFKEMLIDTFGEKFFSEEIIDRMKALADIYEELGLDRQEEVPYPKPVNKLQRQLNAVVDINKISEVLNEGWVPNFNDRTQYKYYVWFEKKASGWVVCYYFYHCYFASLGSGFYFKDSKTASFAGNQFSQTFIDCLPE